MLKHIAIKSEFCLSKENRARETEKAVCVSRCRDNFSAGHVY